MKQFLDQVREFQKASEQTLNIYPSKILEKESLLRFNLMKEENQEYLDNYNDKVEILDALVDQMYVLLGTINTHGMQDIIEEAFNRVHTNNMTKIVDGKVLKNSEGKIIKPKGYKSVNLKDLV